MSRPPPEHPVHAVPYGSVTAPIVRSSTFTYPSSREGAARFRGDDKGLVYSRIANPTVQALERALAELEGGEDAVAAASGMGAIHVTLMSLLRPGARVVADHCVYGCTDSLLRKLERWGVRVTRAETSRSEDLARATQAGVDVVFVETPMNPTLRMVDLARVADVAHAAGGLLVVDNTFATPVAQNPLRWGADLVVHSLTKGINGHSDLLAGAVIGPRRLLDPIRDWVKDAGPVLDPETAWLCLRGIQTLDLRVRASCATAEHLAHVLAERGFRVHHPLLASHPEHALALRQMPLGCAVLAVDLGSEEAAMAFMDGLRVFQRAVSLGGVESLVSHPASTTHAVVPEATRAVAGITPGLVRLSVGVELPAALLRDVEEALARPAPLVPAVS